MVLGFVACKSNTGGRTVPLHQLPAQHQEMMIQIMARTMTDKDKNQLMI